MSKRARTKTFFPDLLRYNPKSYEGFQESSFMSAETLKETLVQKECSPMTVAMISFIQKSNDEIHKLELDRDKALKLAEIEEEKEKCARDAADFKIHMVLNRQVDCILRCKKFYYMRSCPAKIPFKSTATHEEHLAYLRAFIKFQIRPPKTAMEEAEYQNYLSLQNKFFAEQSCLMNFSFEVMKLHLSEINKIPEEINNYLSVYVQHRSKRALKYSKNFTQEMEIPIRPQDPKGNLANLTFDYVGNALSTGTAAQFFLPNPSKKLVLPSSKTWQERRPPACDDEFDRDKYLYKTPVSEDPNAEHLARRHNASIVMSASAFKTLVNNQDTFDKEWTIPVKIKTYDVADSSGKITTQRVAYLDKPLVRKAWLPIQKKKTYYKMAALAQFTHYNTDPTYKIHTSNVYAKDDEVDDSFGSLPKVKPAKSDDSLTFRERIRIYERFAKAEDSPEPSPIAKRNSTKRPNPESNNQPSGFLDGLLSGQSSTFKHQQPSSNRPKSHQITSNIRSYIQNCGSSRTVGLPWTQVIDSDHCGFKVKECPPDSTTNVNYQLFNLQNPNSNESIKILIRHNIHGVAESNNTIGRVCNEAIVVHPKIEGQAYFGIEVNSFHDVVDQWSSLVTKPHAVLLQVHICTETGTVIMGSKKRLVDILQEGKQNHINFRPETVLTSLYVALQTTLRMPTGEYILFHSGKTKAFINLMKAFGDDQSMTSCATVNIYAAYEKGEILSRDYASPPWLAIDTHVLTPFHLHFRKVPATFPMEYDKKLSQNKKSFIKSRAKKKLILKGYG